MATLSEVRDGLQQRLDIYDLELLLARGVCPSAEAVERLGSHTTLVVRVSEKLDLMGWPLFRDQVLPALPREIQVNIDEDEYLRWMLISQH
jgi:hypothetical protein